MKMVYEYISFPLSLRLQDFTILYYILGIAVVYVHTDTHIERNRAHKPPAKPKDDDDVDGGNGGINSKWHDDEKCRQQWNGKPAATSKVSIRPLGSWLVILLARLGF